ncbi:LLM class flavin-dependent oxidoreductase [Pseudonocardia phyllosphaerae]|uniref:LLM class flavin-dependent oxidoreductase n=1 Tax=Pseudonocardia phyllosphaerae TaxID=3390502 RepID=UPI00397A6A2B
MSGRLHLAVEIGGAGAHPGAWRLPGAADPFDAGGYLARARAAAAAGLDLVTIDDTFTPPAPDPAAIPGTPDAVAVAARVAPAVAGIGFVPVVPVTHTEPFHVSKAIATLDFVATGRAGWQPDVSRTAAEADLFGRTGPQPADVLWREAGEVADAVSRLWDSWEDDAEIRDAATGRFVDRDKLHYVDVEGEFFSVKGPSITPRPPQGRPLTVVRGDEPEALPVAARYADVVRVAAPSVAEAAELRERVRTAVADAGRDPETVTVLLDVEVLLGADAADTLRELDRLAPSGTDTAAATLRHTGPADELAALLRDAAEERAADGFTLLPLAYAAGADGLGGVTDALVPALGDLWSPAPYDESLRGRFGLARPASRYAST